MTNQHPSENEHFAAALRAAIQARGLSLDRVRYHLIQRGHELSVATISYWQSGRSRPERASSIAAIAALEEILGVEPGALSGKLPARRRGTSASGQSPAEAADAYLPYVHDLLGRLGLTWDQGLTPISVHDQVVVDAQGRETTRDVKQLFVAERDGVDHYWVYFQAPTLPVVQGLRNCHVSAVENMPELGIVVAQLRLNRSLAKGESVLVEHRAAPATPEPSDRTVERAFLGQVRSAHTEVLFDPACLPLAAERFIMVDGVERVEPVVIVGRSVHALVLDFGPGLYGVRWEW